MMSCKPSAYKDLVNSAILNLKTLANLNGIFDLSNKRRDKCIITLKSAKAIRGHKSVRCPKVSDFHLIDSDTS